MANDQYPIRIDLRAPGGPKAVKKPAKQSSVAAAAKNPVMQSLVPSLPAIAAAASSMYNWMNESSGGKLPKSETKGAPKAKPAVTTRPESAPTVYDAMNAAWLQNLAKSGPISVNAMRGIAGTVPSPAAAVDIQDQIRANEYAAMVQMYQPVLDAAKATNDAVAYETAYNKFRRDVMPLIGVDPLQLQLAQIDENN